MKLTMWAVKSNEKEIDMFPVKPTYKPQLKAYLSVGGRITIRENTHPELYQKILTRFAEREADCDGLIKVDVFVGVVN